MADFATWQDRYGDSQVYFDGSNYGKQGRKSRNKYVITLILMSPFSNRFVAVMLVKVVAIRQVE